MFRQARAKALGAEGTALGKSLRVRSVGDIMEAEAKPGEEDTDAQLLEAQAALERLKKVASMDHYIKS